MTRSGPMGVYVYGHTGTKAAQKGIDLWTEQKASITTIVHIKSIAQLQWKHQK